MAHRGGGPDGPIDVVWTLYARLAEIIERLDRLTGSDVPVLGQVDARPRQRLHVVEGDPSTLVLGVSSSRRCRVGDAEPATGAPTWLVVEDGTGG
ncbi:MAG TPA: hypothetical protein VFD01_23530 [Candidatus Dormibacteraeota bacterium]|jgi:hypothetical protein|nr:hypothetical protein [Candidatus Dormibacteraeota bacterium]